MSREKHDFLAAELETFTGFAGRCNEQWLIERTAEHILRMGPAHDERSGKRRKIGFLALVHGNEIIGLAVINKLIAGLLKNNSSGPFEYFFALGNVPAALQNRRFTESDLNRSFGTSMADTAERRRAKIIEESFLTQCDFVIDLHQTILPTPFPFFLCKRPSLAHLDLIRHLDESVPLVLLPGTEPGPTGGSVNDYLRKTTRIGLTLELGQIGISNDLLEMGLHICRRMAEPAREIETEPMSSIRFPVFSIQHSVRAQQDSRLIPGWENFSKVDPGQIVGHDPSGPIYAADGGYMLFPKYGDPVPKGNELYSICTKVEAHKFKDVL